MYEIHFKSNTQKMVHLNAGGPLLLVVNMQVPLGHLSLCWKDIFLQLQQKQIPHNKLFTHLLAKS